MTPGAARDYGIVGPLAAFPLRLATRAAMRAGLRVHRGVRRQSTHAVIGRGLLARETAGRIEERISAARGSGRVLVSEDGFLRVLGLRTPSEGGSIARQALLDQSRLAEVAFEFLRLFDAFESDAEPFTFRDVILARKYAGLLAGGAGWFDIARSIHRAGPVSSLTAKSLHADRQGGIYARHEHGLAELSGQLLFELERAGDLDLEDAFAEAEVAEEEGRFEEAAELYARCIAGDPADAVPAFNRANCLRAAGRGAEAANGYLRALKRDPEFAEAWFNLADLLSEQGQIDAARRHLRQAIAVDPDYADAIFNLARLEFEADNLAEARRLWLDYLKLDNSSQWARTAQRGIQFVDLQTARKSAG